MTPLRIIELWPSESYCAMCGKYLLGAAYGIAMYEGEPVPDDWSGEWGGFDVCETCYEKDREKNRDAIALELLRNRRLSRSQNRHDER